MGACCKSQEKATPIEISLKKVQEHVSFDAFIKSFEDNVAKGDKFIVYLSAAVEGKDPATGKTKTWSKFCNIADPYVQRHLEKNKSRTVLKGIILSRDEWVGNDSHPYKTHEVL